MSKKQRLIREKDYYYSPSVSIGKGISILVTYVHSSSYIARNRGVYFTRRTTYAKWLCALKECRLSPIKISKKEMTALPYTVTRA